MRRKECDKLLSPIVQDVCGLLQNALAPTVSSPIDAHPVTPTSVIRQMAAITAEIIAPLFADMPDYTGDYTHIFEN